MLYDKSCDIWSLGVTLYILISFKYPFEDEDVESYDFQCDIKFPGSAWSRFSSEGKIKKNNFNSTVKLTTIL